MDSSRRKPVRAQTPEETTEIHIKPLKEAAGGVPAVISSVQHAYHGMGSLRGLKMLRQVNQKDGFDCPGFAWPDPAFSLSIPVVANGDIWSLEDFERCREETGCIHFMLGCGPLARPHLPGQVAAALGIAPQAPHEEAQYTLNTPAD